MEKRVQTTDGRTIRIRVDDAVVASGEDPIASDPEDLDELNETTPMVLVDPMPNAMTVEGAILGIGRTVRGMQKRADRRVQTRRSPRFQRWWFKWARYLVFVIPVLLWIII
jgi:hypothetical protein